jgi:hypothetical protein
MRIGQASSAGFAGFMRIDPEAPFAMRSHSDRPYAQSFTALPHERAAGFPNRA